MIPLRVAIIANPQQNRALDETTEQALGPAYVAELTQGIGHDVALLNYPSAEDDLIDYDVVGFSVNTQDVPKVLQIAEELKIANRNVVTIAGGPHTSGEIMDYYYGERNPAHLPLLESETMDYLVAREAESVLPRLFTHIEDKTPKQFCNIPGVACKEKGKYVFPGHAERVSDLDAISFPTQYRCPETFQQEMGGNKYTFLPIIESRGCPGSRRKTCTFCSSYASWGKQTRYRSGNNVLKEVDDIVQRFDLDSQDVAVFFEGIQTMANNRRFLEIMECCRSKSYPLGSCGDLRLTDPKTLELMAKSNYVDVYWGIESLDPQILQCYKPGLTVENINDRLCLSHELGMRNVGMFIIGFPEETKDSLRSWTENLADLPLDEIRCSIVTPFPGTKLRRELLRKGMHVDPYSSDYDCMHLVYDHPGIREDELLEIQSRCCKLFE